MAVNISLPKRLRVAVGSEQVDFAVKARRAQPRGGSIFMIIFSIFWLAISGIFTVGFIGPIFLGREVRFTVNDVLTVAGPGNLGPIIFPAVVGAVFLTIGILFLVFSIRSLTGPGGYFVGTPTRLVHYLPNSLRSISWKQFSGDIEVRGTEKLGSVSLALRSRNMAGSTRGTRRYVPEIIYLSGITNVSEIGRICRKRIEENDNTLPVVGTRNIN